MYWIKVISWVWLTALVTVGGFMLYIYEPNALKVIGGIVGISLGVLLTLLAIVIVTESY